MKNHGLTLHDWQVDQTWVFVTVHAIWLQKVLWSARRFTV
jgi:hypothetical protein